MALLFVEAFGQLTQDANLKGVVDATEEDLYSVFRARSVLMGWYDQSRNDLPDQYDKPINELLDRYGQPLPGLWTMEEADLTPESDASRIGCAQVGLSVGELEASEPRPSAPIQGWHYAPLGVHRRSIEPSVALPALIQCFVDALRRFGSMDLSAIQVAVNFFDNPKPYSRDFARISELNWFNVASKRRVDALISFDDKFPAAQTQAELADLLRLLKIGTFEFRATAPVPERRAVIAGSDIWTEGIAPAPSGLGIAVGLPEWTPSAIGWALAAVIDTARANAAANAPKFTIRISKD